MYMYLHIFKSKLSHTHASPEAEIDTAARKRTDEIEQQAPGRHGSEGG